LSQDAEQALGRLPEDIRECARFRDDRPDAWYEFNLSRSRASHDGTPPADACAVYWVPAYSRP
jgi:hypothetical protein